MPWTETSVMNEKLKLIEDWLSCRWSKSELSNKYNISRPTVDKWIKRFKASGYSGLEEESRAAKTYPNETPLHQQQAIIEVKESFPNWGPKKIRRHLMTINPKEKWPADSTVGAILKRNGLVKPRKRNRKVSPYPNSLTQSEYPCHVWNIDFKGEGILGNGKKCYPLTISDDYSRYLLCCKGLSSTSRDLVQHSLDTAFRAYGLPEVIKSDNGVPFASRSIGGLSRLSIWLIQLGICPERIQKGKPTQNGRHERIHRTLKDSTMKPLLYSMGRQQRKFDQFRYEYNELRPHEALGQQTPQSFFQQSKVAYTGKTNAIHYGVDLKVRQVRHSGEIKWNGREIYLTQLLTGQPIGLKQVDEGKYEIYYSFVHIGYLDEAKMKITSA